VSSQRFSEAVVQARAMGRVLLDLTEDDPARCGLGWAPTELEGIAGTHVGEPSGAEVVAARDAVASYLAGHGAAVAPEHVVLVRSKRAALSQVLGAICGADGEALVPAQRRAADPGFTVRTRAYALAFDGRWRLDRRSLRRALGASTRAVVVGNPAVPTGAALSGDELEFLADLCAERRLTLVADEGCLDTTLEASVSVAAIAGGVAVHLSGLSGVCGLPALEAEWIAVTGPAPAAGALVAQLSSAAPPPGAGVARMPALLARREEFLARLRARLGRNRSTLASASLREAPWTLQWGGGWWAVLQVNSTLDGDALCTSLLEQGLAVSPGQAHGLPRQGHLVLSLLPTPEVFDAARDRLEELLRRSGLR
jgi:aspartate/methionine/tyrosine aminotransferase